jgi:hypothetical protein
MSVELTHSGATGQHQAHDAADRGAANARRFFSANTEFNANRHQGSALVSNMYGPAQPAINKGRDRRRGLRSRQYGVFGAQLFVATAISGRFCATDWPLIRYGLASV